jgi:hypothetical protein
MRGKTTGDWFESRSVRDRNENTKAANTYVTVSVWGGDGAQFFLWRGSHHRPRKS